MIDEISRAMLTQPLIPTSVPGSVHPEPTPLPTDALRPPPPTDAPASASASRLRAETRDEAPITDWAKWTEDQRATVIDPTRDAVYKQRVQIVARKVTTLLPKDFISPTVQPTPPLAPATVQPVPPMPPVVTPFDDERVLNSKTSLPPFPLPRGKRGDKS